MSYPYPRRASRRHYFLAGLFAGGIAVASILLIASLAKPVPHPPRFTELAFVCSAETLAWHSQGATSGPAGFQSNNPDLQRSDELTATDKTGIGKCKRFVIGENHYSYPCFP